MPPLKDLAGQKFGRLTVIEKSHPKNKKTFWLCECDCGNTTIVSGQDMKNGRIKSCGCIRKERGNHFIHGDSHKRLHNIWSLMFQRCYNPKASGYKNYGGRGISICDEWRKYPVFKDWALANGYADDLTIDRIDNDGNYEPSNCKWSTYKEQAQNKRNTNFFN